MPKIAVYPSSAPHNYLFFVQSNLDSGIPHSSLMMNAINQPSPFGMKQFADALIDLF